VMGLATFVARLGIVPAITNVIRRRRSENPGRNR
jgi:hypothetical protein